MIKIIAGLMMSLLLTGCASTKHAYQEAQPNFSLTSTQEVTVGALDQRFYILNNDKEDNYVGQQYKGRRAVDVYTSSKVSFAEDIANVAGMALSRKGISSFTIRIPKGSSHESAKQLIIDNTTGRGVLITVRDWRSETATRTKLTYDMSMEVYAADGSLYAEKTIQGTDDVGTGINPLEHAKLIMPIVFQKKLEELFNDSSISRALQ